MVNAPRSTSFPEATYFSTKHRLRKQPLTASFSSPRNYGVGLGLKALASWNCSPPWLPRKDGKVQGCLGVLGFRVKTVRAFRGEGFMGVWGFGCASWRKAACSKHLRAPIQALVSTRRICALYFGIGSLYCLYRVRFCSSISSYSFCYLYATVLFLFFGSMDGLTRRSSSRPLVWHDWKWLLVL